MSKKDYILIATVLRDYPYTDGQDKVVLAARFAYAFKQDNPRFDTSRFMLAVTVKEIG